MIQQLQFGPARNTYVLRKFAMSVSTEPFGDISRGGPSGFPDLIVKSVVVRVYSAAA